MHKRVGIGTGTSRSKEGPTIIPWQGEIYTQRNLPRKDRNAQRSEAATAVIERYIAEFKTVTSASI
jgi:hypothetical protein